MSAVPPPILEVRGLVGGYGPSRVLHGIDLAVAPGEIVSLLGANGAGKSTTLAALSGLLPGAQGSIRLEGEELLGASAPAIVARGLVQVPERRQLFGGMSVEDNLLLGSFLRRDSAAVREDLARCFELFPRLAERRSQLAKTMSGGEQQMLAIGRAMMAQPKVLLLDEPSLGLAPVFVQLVFDLAKKLRDDGRAILLVEQNARAALAISDRAYVMAVGRITSSGSAQALQNDPAVQEAYLGSENEENSMEARLRAYRRDYVAPPAHP